MSFDEGFILLESGFDARSQGGEWFSWKGSLERGSRQGGRL